MSRLVTVLMVVLMLVLLATATASATITTERKAIRIAKRQIGKPYVYGANGPKAFDCSGLIQWAYRHAGLRHFPRTAQQQYRRTRHIRLRAMKPGDLIFDHTGPVVFHVEMYLGRGRVIEAARPGVPVRVARVWRVPRWAGTVRPK